MRLALSLVALSLSAVAQAQTPTTMTLDEAVGLARRNNPTFNAQVNQRRSADADVRAAYATFLPTLGAGVNGNYQKSGNQFVSGVALGNASDVVQAGYGIRLNYNINSAILFAPKLVGARRDAAEADVVGGAEFLRSRVTQDYLGVLQAQANAALTDTLMATRKGQLELARARQSVGAGTVLDVRQAEVAYGQAEVALLQARNAAEVGVLRFFELIGVARPENVVFTTKFPITPFTLKLDSLQDLARTTNPGLNALKSSEKAATLNVRANQGQYAPTLSFSTGWGGNASKFTDDNFLIQRDSLQQVGRLGSCIAQDEVRVAAGLASLNCNTTYAYNPASGQAAVAANDEFNYIKAPRSFQVSVNMNIFDGLGRETRLQNAQIQRDNAKFNVKARELGLKADVTQAYLNLQTAIKTVEMQEVNAALAREQLSFAEERYRVGAATFLELTTSRGTFEQASIDRLNSIYNYHRSFAALENAVGRPLR
jgi:outer membrane protein